MTTQSETIQTIEQAQSVQPYQKKLINIEEVKAITGFSTTTIYKLMNKGEFPKAKKCGRSTRWRLADIESYIAS
ncbi:AlpA family phage regulatory protein [Histophilus somni]|uniref:Helix-turn-helix domain-containing protein n=1 Tax=Histophilus somni (strain 129Pt) TaxID=205914 RepID=Q0I230_HISS1|nr:AlpA family phage regulatory protein [Histophilus somni]QEH18212.1 AlpA family phage regulatory protein [Histophilus somni]QEH50964.1 AlpA family phage regulatory protein [Histophilus somni]THA21069.1 AlpA family phage regulatory protein [Histophilus somni]